MGRHRKKRAMVPVRTGLLGASAAVAVGAVAVASGLLPGGDTYKVGGGPSAEHIRTGAPELRTQGEASATPTGRAPASPSPSRSAERPQTPSKTPTAKPTPTPSPTKPSATPSKRAKAPEPSASTQRATPKSASPSRTATPKSASPSRTATATPQRTVESTTARVASKERAAEAAVLSLVNAERAKVGCSPVRPNAELASLAGAFSLDMAQRNFFSHTDPDGDSPWDRASQAGVSSLAAENIARGQSDAQAVMESWMNSDGHRANILNCDYTTLGVGVHFAEGGPWWTQDFGF
ncbi:CAP domain-containing protein [Streptomyces sp. NPDC045431]|uniref:CAP domain-containing protein n=1 Tax=Streptomyces sp. NPDC045431 TaxID=3155613 RepID=UPI0033FE1A6D